jgi:glc operon protein GlcG
VRDYRSAAMTLTLEDANRMIQAALGHASKLGIRVTVAVVDEGGHLVALGRMDGAPPLSPQIAEGKAVGAAMLLRDGATLLQMAQDRPHFFGPVSRMTRVPMVPGPGSIPIQRKGRAAGAVGVSGGKPEQDLECAEAGVASL